MSRKTEKGRTTVQLIGPITGDPRKRLERKIARVEQIVAELKAAPSPEAQRPLWAELAEIADQERSAAEKP